MEHTQTEENYLKVIYLLSRQSQAITTKLIGEMLAIKSPTVSDMLRRLGEKGLIRYARYKEVSLTSEGEMIALKVIRKHRLWETFLVQKFDFKWDEVHDIAEQLEHVNSPELVDRLEKYLDYPEFDPHGDPIPSKNGAISYRHNLTLDQGKIGEEVVVVGVKDHTAEFLKYLESLNIQLGTRIKVLDVVEYDKSKRVNIHRKDVFLSNPVCKNLLVKEV